MKNVFYVLTIVIVLLLSVLPVSAQRNHVYPGELIIEPATLTAIGFQWKIFGDDNHTAYVEVRYRPVRERRWRDALPMLRIGNEIVGTENLSYVTPRMFAGSIMNLLPDTEYECRLAMKDRDGVRGDAVKEVVIKTRSVPRAASGGRVRHVYPKDWTSYRQEPWYNGLLHAYYGFPRVGDWNMTTDPAQPGDVILVHRGVYKADYKEFMDYHGLTFHGTYHLTRKGSPEEPIVIRAAGDGDVVFDGNGTYNLFNMMAADYNYLEGITIRDADVAVIAGIRDVMGARGIVVRNCRFEDVGIGIMAQDGNCSEYYIADNVFLGREEQTLLLKSVPNENGEHVKRLKSYYAVKVYGPGHVICNNYIAYFHDGIDISTHGTPEYELAKKSVSIDIYNNDIYCVNDNFIEADGGTYNIRILRNRCVNGAGAPFSNEPVLGGPVYWIRNISYHTPESPAFSFESMNPAGILAYHNTVTTFMARSDQGCSNVHFRNNLFLPPSDCGLPVIGLMTYTSYSSSDYNGYWFAPSNNSPIEWLAPSADVISNYDLTGPALGYKSLSGLRSTSNQELNSVMVDFDVFANVPEPIFAAYSQLDPAVGPITYPVYLADSLNFQLKPGSIAVDAGVVLPNVNDEITGDQPDLGALELGLPLPHWGPR